MTFEQWRPIAALLENTYKDEFDDLREAAYFRVLGHLSAELVTRAVEAIAGGRSITDPPVSAAGAYLPSAETIARECSAQAFIGTAGWAVGQLVVWINVQRRQKYRTAGTYQLEDADFTAAAREQLTCVDERYGRMLVELVDSYGLAVCDARYASSPLWHAHARRRWERLTAESGGQLIQLTR